MLDQITYRQLLEWSAFYQIEPFGDLRDDIRSGWAAASICNHLKGKGSPASQLEDFFYLNDSVLGGSQTALAQIARCKMIASMHNRGQPNGE